MPVIRPTRTATFAASPHVWAALCCTTLLAQAVAALSGTTISFGAFLALNGLGIGCAACVALRAREATISIACLIGWAVVLRACALLMAPFFEDDYFRFLWDGYLSVATGSPYRGSPEDFFAMAQLPVRMQQILGQVGYPEVPTIYGPTLQLLFAAASTIAAGSPGALRVLFIIVDMVAVTLLARHARAQDAVLYAWNPFVVLESIAQIHPDGLIGLLLLAIVLCAMQRRWLLASIWWALLLAAKSPVALAIAPLLFVYAWRCERRALPRIAATVSLTALLLYGSFDLGSHAELAGLATFASRWQFNGALYAALAAGIGAMPARVACAIMLMAICMWLANGLWRARSALDRQLSTSLLTMLSALLLFSPVLNPWYLLWLLPLAACRRAPGFWLACMAVLLAHGTAGAMRLETLDPFALPVPLQLLEFALLAAAVLLQWRRIGVPMVTA